MSKAAQELVERIVNDLLKSSSPDENIKSIKHAIEYAYSECKTKKERWELYQTLFPLLNSDELLKLKPDLSEKISLVNQLQKILNDITREELKLFSDSSLSINIKRYTWPFDVILNFLYIPMVIYIIVAFGVGMLCSTVYGALGFLNSGISKAVKIITGDSYVESEDNLPLDLELFSMEYTRSIGRVQFTFNSFYQALIRPLEEVNDNKWVSLFVVKPLQIIIAPFILTATLLGELSRLTMAAVIYAEVLIFLAIGKATQIIHVAPLYLYDYFQQCFSENSADADNESELINPLSLLNNAPETGNKPVNTENAEVKHYASPIASKENQKEPGRESSASISNCVEDRCGFVPGSTN